MARRSTGSRGSEAKREAPDGQRPLEPIRVVKRELTRPDGTKVRVDVPVYPPFQLPQRPPPERAPARGRRKPSRG